MASGCNNFQRQLIGSRRDFLRVGSLSGLGLALGDVLKMESAMAAQKDFDSIEGTAKSVIQIVLPGGIAAQETWNPKPEAPLEYRGPFGVNKTKIPGVVVGEMWPEIAKVADKMCVVRSLVGNIPDHGQAQYNMFTGYKMSPAIKHPSMGSIINHEFGPRNDLPAYIGVPQLSGEGMGTGYLAEKYGAFTTGGDPAGDQAFQVRDLRLPDGLEQSAFASRQRMRDVVNEQFRKLEADPGPLDTMDSYYQQAYSMLSSESVRNAFDLSQESEKMKEMYGKGTYLSGGTYGSSLGSQAGLRMLLARRLVQAGARFVTLNYETWDDHDIIEQSYRQKMPAFDHALAALLRDLDDRGMLDNTLVWVASEFGRTPKINASGGRDHWTRVFSQGMAGGGLKRGLFYGDSDATSSDPGKDGLHLTDFHSTIYKLIGINSDKELMAPGERPMEIVDGGKPCNDLIA